MQKDQPVALAVLPARSRPPRPALLWSAQVERDCHLLGLELSCSRPAKGAMGDVWFYPGLWAPQVLIWWMGGREESTSHW